LAYNGVSTEVSAGSKEQEGGKRKIKIKKRKETSFVQRSASHSPTQQNGTLQKLCSHKSHQGENSNMCGEKTKKL
jgi:hypothetical protein